MTAPLSFKAACKELSHATCSVAWAAWRAPFTGGKVRTLWVVPLALVSFGAAKAIHDIATFIFVAFAKKCAQGAGALYRSFLGNPQNYPQPVRAKADRRPVQRPIQGKTLNPLPPTTSPSPLSKELSVKRIPLNADIGKERNESLIRGVTFLEKYFFEPCFLQNKRVLEKGKAIDPFFASMIDNPSEIRSLFRSTAVWLLSLYWNKGALQFVASKMSPPSTIESIVREIRAFRLEEFFEAQLVELVSRGNQETAHQQVAKFQEAVTENRNCNGRRLDLLALSLKLDSVLKQIPKDEAEIESEKKEHLHSFAVGMNEVFANSLLHVAEILQGVMKGVKKIAPEKISSSAAAEEEIGAPSPQPAREEATRAPNQERFDSEIQEVITILSEKLGSNYLAPLYQKHEAKWRKCLDKEPGSPELFLDEGGAGLDFLAEPQAENLPTETISEIFFLKTILQIEKQKTFPAFIQRIPEGLFIQVKPTLVKVLTQSVSMVSEVSIERTALKMVDFANDILTLCDAMKSAKVGQLNPPEDVPDEPNKSRLSLALQRGGMEKSASEKISRLHLLSPCQDTQGESIINALEEKQHEVVQSFQKDYAQAERDWVEDKITTLKRLLREKTSDYTQSQDGQWLASLFENKENQVATGLLGTIFDLQRKIQAYSPLAANILKVLISGLQKFIESEGVAKIQDSIDQFSSTGFLSSKIATRFMSFFLDLSTADEDWKKNLPLLQKAYLYLSTDEQKTVKDHLKFLYTSDKLNSREKDLTGANAQSPNEETSNYLKLEMEYAEALRSIEQANTALLQQATRENEPDILELEAAYSDLKTQKGLVQFKRIKGLVLFIVNNQLSNAFQSRPKGLVLAVIMSFLEKAFDLLRYQKVVKHWVFTIIDLVMKELEIVSGLKSPDEEDTFESKLREIGQNPSICEMIEAHDRHLPLMQKLSKTASDCNRDWGAAGMLASFNYAASSLTGPFIWEKIKTSFNESSRVSSQHLAEKIATLFFNFGKDPNRLSTIVIEALTECVADPRPESSLPA